jgi:divalent metal cation (Fe/Co/Zn/Cd) transporter
VHNYGPGRIIAALHVEVDGKRDIFESHDMIDLIEQRLRTEQGIEATIHLDPIVTDDEKIIAMRSEVLAAVHAVDERLRIHDFRYVEGKTHTNLIFDIEAPFEIKESDEELRRAVADRVSRIHPNYFIVAKVDRS